jgi:hypothetical protein
MSSLPISYTISPSSKKIAAKEAVIGMFYRIRDIAGNLYEGELIEKKYYESLRMYELALEENNGERAVLRVKPNKWIYEVLKTGGKNKKSRKSKKSKKSRKTKKSRKQFFKIF